MKTIARLALVLLFAASAAPMAAPRAGAFSPAERELAKANYDLASRWTAAKVGKMVFSTAVTPHWLEFSDRFWYNYETPAGMKWWIVDPVKKTKTPLWDNAKIASQLTRILRTPYDAQHLPITTLRFFDNDTKVRFSVTLPREARVEGADGQELTGETQQQENQVQGGGVGRAGRGGGGQRGGGQGRAGGAAGAGGAANNKQWWIEYELATGNMVVNDKYETARANPTWAAVSPDKKTIIFARGHNLFMMDAANFELAKKTASDNTIQETQLTTDGEKYYSFARNGQGGQAQIDQLQQQDTQQETTQTTVQGATPREQSDADKKFGPRTAAIGASWAQDGTRFSVSRTDQRKVADLWVINSLAMPRPTLNTYKYGMPGEENQPQEELDTFSISAKKQVKIKVEAFKDQQLGLETAPVTNLEREKAAGEGGGRGGGGGAAGGGGGVPSRWIASSGDKVYFNRTSRDLKRIDIVEADTSTGESRVIVPERSNTYIEIQPVRLINGGKELIHWSERDGWGHYYLYDVATAKVKRQIDAGEYVDTGIVSVDDKTRTLYLNASGKEQNEDPYFTHFYKVNIDTGEMKLLDAGNASHAVNLNDKCTYFVDNSSRIDKAPESALYDTLGNKVMDLEKTDVSMLTQAGFRYPEAFTVKADDGITDLDGVMFKPFDFDETKKYPIIEYVYPGPQTESVTKTFNPREQNVALANIGFIVIEVGNRGGSPQRSKWYHNYGYGNLRDYGLADKKAAVEQLAKLDPWIDLSRVGMYGHSGGGFMTAAAMFGFPDFYKVGISESGNHDNSIYNRWWSEKHDGVKELPPDKDGNVKFEYDIDKNQDIAKNLKGHLLLMTGDYDNNVHPSNTFRVVDALIKADKRFDLLVLPGQPHSYGPDQDYVFWRRIDYFAKWLLGAEPVDTDMLELQREREMKK